VLPLEAALAKEAAPDDVPGKDEKQEEAASAQYVTLARFM
jgi:hypothetical protein